MPITFNATNGITFNDGSTQNTRPAVGFRNRIINGDMAIDQRGAASSPVTLGIGNPFYVIDRFNVQTSQASKLSCQQNAGGVTPPAGFPKYFGFTSLSAYSVLSADFFTMQQRIEGFNTADFNFGTVNAKTVTLSFLVYSSLTGTFGGSLGNNDFNRSYPFTYAISTANTWTQITVTVAGDTSGTWAGATNSVGLYVTFGLGVGSTYSGTAGSWQAAGLLSATGATSVVGTNGATFYITGVQLEAGSTATEFERRPIGTELALCQRYYQVFSDLNLTIGGRATNASTTVMPIVFRTNMRATPTTVSGTILAGSSLSFSATADTCRVIGTADLNGVLAISAMIANSEL
jgi:hypothetical protein